MTILFDEFADLADGPVSGVVEIWRPDLAPDTDGPGATTTNRVVVSVVDGAMTTPDLDPGPARVMLRLGTWAPPRDIVIPDSAEPVRLTELFGQYEPQPPAVVSEAWQAAQAAQAARDEAVAAVEGVADISEDAAQVAADRVAAQVARTGAETAAADADTDRLAAQVAAASATADASAAAADADSASASASTASNDRAAAQSAAGEATSAASVATAARDTATSAAADADASAVAAAQSAADAAGVVSDGIPNASDTIKGGLRLAGDLGGTWDAPTVPGLAGKAAENHTHPLSDVDGLAAELDGKADTGHQHTTADISDLPTALDGKQGIAARGQAGGYAPLDESGHVPAAHLPSYVDDILEFAGTAAFPGTGVSGRIYVALDTSRIYRWSGSAYVEISPSPGSTDAVPEGATNRYFTDGRAQAAVAAALAAKAEASVVVNLAGTQTITGAKTFDSSPTVPAPTASGHAARKADVDAKVGSDGTVGRLLKMTQAEYDALGSGRPATTWFGIVG